MSFELQAETLCDHRVRREFTFMDRINDPSHRELRIFQPISNNNVRLWYNGVEYAQDHEAFGWKIVVDERSASEFPKKKIVFNRAIRDANGFFEISYTTYSQLCRKCYGRDILYDHAFDSTGRLILVLFEQKLIQQVIKILMTKIGSNPFVTGYGTSIPDVIYTAIRDPEGLKSELVTEVSLAIEKQRNIHYYQNEVQYHSPREILDRLIDVQVARSNDDPRVYYIAVEVSTLAGDTTLIRRELFLGELFNSSPIRATGV